MANELLIQRECNTGDNRLRINRDYFSQRIWAEDDSVPYDGPAGLANINSLAQTQCIPSNCIVLEGWEQWPHPWLDGQGENRPGEYQLCDDWYIKDYCIRGFIWTCIYHDGLKIHYDVSEEFKVMNLGSADRGHVKVSAVYPFVTDCWDFADPEEVRGRQVFYETAMDGKNTFHFFDETLLDSVGKDPIMNIAERRYGSLEGFIKCVPPYTPFDLAVIGKSFKRVRKKCIPCRCHEAVSWESMSSYSTQSSLSSASSHSSTSESSSGDLRGFRIAARAIDTTSMSSQSYSSRSSLSESSISSKSYSSRSTDSMSSRSTESTSGPGPVYDEACTCDSSHGGITPWMPKETMPANHKLSVVFRMCNKGIHCSLIPT